MLGVGNNIVGGTQDIFKFGLQVSYIVTKVNNSWRCNLASDGKFYVGVVRSKFELSPPCHIGAMVNWLKAVSIKVTCFIWKATLSRIPSMVALVECLTCFVVTQQPFVSVVLILIQIHVITAPQQLNTHIIFSLVIALQASSGNESSNGVGEIVNYAASWGYYPRGKKLIIIICYGRLWLIWKASNVRIFNHYTISPTKTADNIIALVFLCYKYRGKGGLIGRIGVSHHYYACKLKFSCTLCPAQYLVMFGFFS
uniref:Reverse transcriptase zinc-binding domain-containing protein n=1 Tax=Lactuca sativa TaxID=4236 RepID=A0A9R1VGE8_LACSA|nr:hypothetical protein LSAT_V11C500296160 [Lactuca sativa]